MTDAEMKDAMRKHFRTRKTLRLESSQHNVAEIHKESSQHNTLEATATALARRANSSQLPRGM